MPTVEIDGKEFEVEAGKMLIEVTDAQGIRVPRFCYHKKLSVAANCRMCLVEVERAPKPMPACATPIMDGMKVYTRSPKALAAQKNVMEFLLINHPLDCPICDQGGECELQDVSMGYGEDVSQYNEGKRSVDDENLGSLIATEMTRCIHCTRCVRFGEEVAGLPELGATSRGEKMRIGTYIESSLHTEVSGNVIDLCPVGALTSKPYRFKARAWELQERPAIAPHDCLGSHIFTHTRRQQVMRVVPRECETINETWLSDRDRYAYTGLYQDRLVEPLVKRDGIWQKTDWQSALIIAIDKIKHTLGAHGRHEFGALTSSYATCEEMYVLQKLLRALGVNHIDYRVAQQDFRDDASRELFPGTNLPYEKFSSVGAALLIGSDIAREQPLAAVRLRKAHQNGAKLYSLNCFQPFGTLELDESQVVHPADFASALLSILKAAMALNSTIDVSVPAKLLEGVTPTKQDEAIAKQLHDSESSVIVLGAMIEMHPDAADLRSIARAISVVCGAGLAEMTLGPNQAGGFLSGAVPHRGPGGKAIAEPGCNAYQMMTEGKKGYLLLHLEPENDCVASGRMLENLEAAECVVAITAYDSPQLREYADVILPAAAFAETSGTFVNFEGRWQSFHASTKPIGEARPAWKILRVLGNLIDLEGFDFTSTQEILDELQSFQNAPFSPAKAWQPTESSLSKDQIIRIGPVGIYASDPMQRRAAPLHEAASNFPLKIRVSPNVAKKYNLRHGKDAVAMQNKVEVHSSVFIDETLPENCVFVPWGETDTAGLGAMYDPIDLK